MTKCKYGKIKTDRFFLWWQDTEVTVIFFYNICDNCSVILYKGIRLTCSSLSVLCVRLSASLSLFLPLSPAEPSRPGRELSTGVFIPAVIWASISSKLLPSERKRGEREGGMVGSVNVKSCWRSWSACIKLFKSLWFTIIKLNIPK